MAKKKVMIDDGHGTGTPGKRTPDGYQENKFNKAVVDFLNTHLKRCGFETSLAAPGDTDASLKSRTDKANKWGADAFVSVHYNALKDHWRDGEGGIETFHYPGSKTGKDLATCIHKHLVKGTKLKDRGVKSGDLHVLRESNMPAALPECGFMDIKKEAELMKSAAYQKECAEEIAKGICDFFDVTYVPDKKVIAPKPATPVAAKPKPAAAKPSPIQADLHKVTVDGKPEGVYGSKYNVVQAVERALKAGKKDIKIEGLDD